MIGMRRTMRQPGWSRVEQEGGEARARGSSEVRAIRMKCGAVAAPVMNHLRPCTTQRSPRFSARVRIIDGSEPQPGCGSVMTNDERTAPSTIGCSQRAFCASVPTLSSTIMLPSSGAAQLKVAGPKIERFISS